MAFEVNLPRLGWDMVEGSLATWLKQDGEFVKAGELLFTVEGDKAIQEIESYDSGYLRILPDGPQPGQKVPVGTILGYLVSESELDDFEFPNDSTDLQATLEKVESKELKPNARATQQDGFENRGSTVRRIYISPYAKRLAEGRGVDWKSLKGSGSGGRIMANDVKAEVSAMELSGKTKEERYQDVSEVSMIAPPKLETIPPTRILMTQIHRKIAEHMAASVHTTAPVTLTTEVDATEIVALRKHLKEDLLDEGQSPPSYNDMLTKIAAKALLEHPWMNARIDGDEIIQMNSVHVAIAVDTNRGLLVPVLRDVQTKSLRRIARESVELIEKTRSGTIGLNEMQDGTFTITNLGMYDIDAFTPIIDLPQCAIMGVGQIVAKQVVVDVEREKVAIRQRMVLSLTFDHRLVDGAQAARFLQRVKRLVEKPYLWLAG